MHTQIGLSRWWRSVPGKLKLRSQNIITLVTTSGIYVAYTQPNHDKTTTDLSW